MCVLFGVVSLVKKAFNKDEGWEGEDWFIGMDWCCSSRKKK